MNTKDKTAEVSSSPARIQILATTDLHMNLTGFDYYSDRKDPRIGFTRTASLIRAAQDEAHSEGVLSLLFDNGDALQGTPFGDWAAAHCAETHPLPQAFNRLGYDAVGLGNHDFSFGLDLIDGFASQLNCPVLCSNLDREPTGAGWRPYTVLSRNITHDTGTATIKIGVMSALPPQTTMWERHKLDGQVASHDILRSAEETVSTLRNLGCDLIIVLAHSGLQAESAGPGLENTVIQLAAIDGIDVIIAGHTHLTLPGPAHDHLPFVDARRGRVHGKPVVMAGSAGSYLGVIDITLDNKMSGAWTICDFETELRSICPKNTDVLEDPEMVALFARGHAETRTLAPEPVGRLETSIHSYFAYCAPDRALALLAAAQAAALRALLNDDPASELPVLSAVAPAKFGGRSGPDFYTDIPAGDISMRHVADIHLFPNELRAVRVTGVQLSEWLEMSAGIFRQLNPDSATVLTDPDRAGHNFDIIHGLTYEIDLSQPARYRADGHLSDPEARRIRNLRWQARPVDDAAEFVVATNNYRVNGGGNFNAVTDARKLHLPSCSIQSVLRDYLAESSQVDPLEHAENPFGFSNLGGAKAILETGPKALDHIDELDPYAPELLGTDAQGFLRIALTL
ncbi:bifunctional 2',3'-cyclic-nucleotide 2'-phosphodiesterase/3'-nucleotidase [Ruegeria sp. HKCCA6707]|uniref:bifunctional 2',3'-cyclic-nucleotide 2'-phosphodiesterase/3'-nucleotidase n=1 Tax=Ruegeria sp. HKCCA6707 TaxID=2682996 RepID=UPI001489E5E2|nr:bifunctional 2',3'-cyclic-nucleotide 2'-phosphodiesterase/3'-nucleotidase [Ruegeria sp. HKCCA6707]